MARPLNPEDELFWQRVREAYDQLVTGAETTSQIVVTLANREATIERASDFCFVYIREVPLPVHTLVGIAE